MKAFIAFLLFLCMGCEKLMTDGIVGNWMYPAYYDDNVVIMQRVRDIGDNEYGFSFRENGECSEFKNAGWCGTPPVTYTEFQGSWYRTDSVVDIVVGYYGGMAHYRWIIVSVDRKNLVYRADTVHYISTD